MNVSLQRKSCLLSDITKLFHTEGEIDPVYIPDPDRKLPKPIGFELKFNSKINSRTHHEKPIPTPKKSLKNSSPPGLELQNNQLKCANAHNIPIIIPIIIPPSCSFLKEPKDKLKLYELKLNKQENVLDDNLPVGKNVWIKVNTKTKKYKRGIIKKKVGRQTERKAEKKTERWGRKPLLLSRYNKNTRRKSYRKRKDKKQ